MNNISFFHYVHSAENNINIWITQITELDVLLHVVLTILISKIIFSFTENSTRLA